MYERTDCGKNFLYRVENKVGLGFCTRKNIELISLVQPNMPTKATFILLFIYHISWLFTNTWSCPLKCYADNSAVTTVFTLYYSTAEYVHVCTDRRYYQLHTTAIVLKVISCLYRFLSYFTYPVATYTTTAHWLNLHSYKTK